MQARRPKVVTPRVPLTNLTPATARLLDSAAGLTTARPDLEDPRARALLGDFLRLYSNWIITHRGMEGSVATWAEQSRILLHCMVGATTLTEAMVLNARFSPVFWGDRNRMEIRDDGDAVALVFHEAQGSGVDGLIGAMWPLIATLRQLEFLAGEPLNGVYGRLRNGSCLPQSTAKLLFRHPIHYDAAEAALVVPADQMRRAVVVRAGDVAAFFEHFMFQTVTGSGMIQDMRSRVETVLRSDRLRQTQASADLPSVAARLGCSTATLRRRLLAEGTTFRTVREDVLDSLARTWLQETDHSIEQIAAMLGYSDPYGFRRAFRRRNPMSPSEYRTRAISRCANLQWHTAL